MSSSPAMPDPGRRPPGAGPDPASDPLDADGGLSRGRIVPVCPQALLAAGRPGVFGGSFDPVHRGHLLVAREALESGQVDGLLVIPARVSPHKQDRRPAPADARIELLRLALGELPPDLAARTWISRIEVEAAGPSFTSDTLDRLRAAGLARGGELRLVLGQDSLSSLPRWRAVDRILASARPCVVARAGDGALEATAEAVRAALPPAQAREFAPVLVDPSRPSDASSTSVRRALESGASADLDHLSPRVREAIQERELYERFGRT